MSETVTLEEAIADKHYTEQWYAVRFEKLKDFFRDEAKDTEIAHTFWHIIANGTRGTHEPPTYAQQMNELRHERDLLRRQVGEKDRQIESLVLLFGADMSCEQCGLLGGPGPSKDSRTCCDGVPDICEHQLRRWSIEQAKKGGGDECFRSAP